MLLWNPAGARTRRYPRHGWTSQVVVGQGQGQPCMPHWAACFRHRGKKNKRNPNSVYTNHITLDKLNAKNSGSNEFQKSASVAISSHEARLFNRQKFVSIVSQQYFGRPTRLCPAGCQANILLIQRCPGNVAKYCATFQWCRKQSSDHDLDAAKWWYTRDFHN